MRIIKDKSGYAHKDIVAQLEDDEVDLPDAVLVMMADGVERSWAEECHAKELHPGHFGWRNFRKNGVNFSVTIHTD